jgi:hypothetical protein
MQGRQMECEGQGWEQRGYTATQEGRQGQRWFQTVPMEQGVIQGGELLPQAACTVEVQLQLVDSSSNIPLQLVRTC